MEQPPILICYDGSAAADGAIAAAAGLLGNRRAVVVNVASPLTVSESFAALGSPGPADFEELNEESALERASAGAEIARKAGFDAAAHPEVGAPTWETIVELADELDAAAIVIGSRGLSGAKELLKGSLSHEVAEHADRPVLIVPPARPRQ
jgi:nucleotide-binding universal stress UspA family protein